MKIRLNKDCWVHRTSERDSTIRRMSDLCAEVKVDTLKEEISAERRQLLKKKTCERDQRVRFMEGENVMI
jgi:hypothetical protein